MTAANEHADDARTAGGPSATPHDGVETAVGAESPRAPIADVGTAAFDGVDVYSGDDVFGAPTAYDGASVYEAAPAFGVADAYEGPTAFETPGAYEPEGAYTPAVTPVAADEIVPEGAVASPEQGEPARVDPIGVYVPEGVPAAALPQDEITESQSAVADVAAGTAETLPGRSVSAVTGEPVTPTDATAGKSAVRFDE